MPTLSARWSRVWPSPMVTTRSGGAKGRSSRNRQTPGEVEGVEAVGPLGLEIAEPAGDGQAVPVVDDVEQIAASRAGEMSLVDRERRRAGRVDALLEAPAAVVEPFGRSRSVLRHRSSCSLPLASGASHSVGEIDRTPCARRPVEPRFVDRARREADVHCTGDSRPSDKRATSTERSSALAAQTISKIAGRPIRESRVVVDAERDVTSTNVH